MKKTLSLSAIVLFLFFAWSCQDSGKSKTPDFVSENAAFAADQYGIQTLLIEESGKVLNPKTLRDGKMDQRILSREHVVSF